MKLSNLRDRQRRAVYLSRIRKAFLGGFKFGVTTSIPVFVLGAQRSGTSMFIDTLHLRPDTQVFSESDNNKAFFNYQLRSLDTIDNIIRRSPAPFVCFKPIADSHIVSKLRERFPAAAFIWLYRQYEDVANSRLRKFAGATRAIRLVCQGKDGAGWFGDGIDEDTSAQLQSLPYESLTEFDFACLAWWARNRIFEVNSLWNEARVVLLSYENLVADPEKTYEVLEGRIGLPYNARAFRFIHRRSVGRNPAPNLNDAVREMCEANLQLMNSHCDNPLSGAG